MALRLRVPERVWAHCAACSAGRGWKFYAAGEGSAQGADLGLAPFVATSLLGYGTWAVAVYLIAGAVMSGVCLLAIGSAHQAEPAGGESDAQPLTPAEA